MLIPGAPLGVITESVQALAGVLLPSASVFLLLLCNDPEVLGPWRNPGWLNVLASVIVAILVLLSLILMATTVFPNIDVTKVALIGGALLAVGLLAFGLLTLRSRRATATVAVVETGPKIPKEQWTMPPLALLARPQWSTGRKIAMLTLRGYLARRDDPAARQSHPTRRRITRGYAAARPDPGTPRAATRDEPYDLRADHRSTDTIRRVAARPGSHRTQTRTFTLIGMLT